MPYKDVEQRKAAHAQRQRNYRSRHDNYVEHERIRLRSFHANEEWSLLSAVKLTVDGEDMRDDGCYSQFAVGTPDGDKPIVSPPGKSLGFLETMNHIRKIKNHYRKMTRQRVHISGYYTAYDFHSLILRDISITLEQKYAIKLGLSKRHSAIRGPDYQDIVEMAQLGIGVKLRPKTLEVWWYKMDRNKSFLLDKDGKKQIRDHLKIEDIGSIFAMRMDLAVQLFRSEVSPEDMPQFDHDCALLARGKAARGDFKSAGMTEADILAYNSLELSRLRWLVDILVKLYHENGLRPRSLAGPAPGARALLEKYGLKSHLKTTTYDEVSYQEGPEMDWHRDSFHAGRIEQSFIGYVPAWYEADTRNAYVAALRAMPCAAHAIERPLTIEELRQANEDKIIYPGWEYEIVYRCDTQRKFGPFAHRHNGGTEFPLRGRERVYGVEIQAFFATLGNDKYDIVAGLAHESTCEEPYPFATMTIENYESRRVHKHDGRLGLAEIEKKAMLSVYGVTAQTAGGYRTIDEHGKTLSYKTPEYSNLWAAGFITAFERARQSLFNRAYGDLVFGHATDAVFLFEVPNGMRDHESDALGELEIKQHGPTVFFGAGIRVAENAKETKRRGFTVDIPFSVAMNAYREGETELTISYRHFKGLPESLHKQGDVITLDDDAATFQVREKIITISLDALKSKRDISRPVHVTAPDGTDFWYAPPPRMGQGDPLRYQRPFDPPPTSLLSWVLERGQRNMETYQP